MSNPIQYRLTRYREQLDDDAVFALTRDPLPEVGLGQVRVRMSHVSIDPGMRGSIRLKSICVPPVRLGEVVGASSF
ncbi:MAG: hypothetical protein ACOYM8_12665 [Caulobacterales bacterium]